MKKALALLLLTGLLTACNDTDGDGNKDINIHIDLDSTGDKIKTKAKEMGDSAAARTERLGKEIEKRADSIHL